jgi:hypothetical protein
MNNKKLIYALAVASLLITIDAKAIDLGVLFDTNLDQFMVDVSTHDDFGQRALEAKISSIEETDGQFSPKLYGYLAELSNVKLTSKNHEEALDLYLRMQTLTHWVDGVNSPLQLEAIRLQSDSLVALGQVDEADQIERFHFSVSEKNYEGEALLPFLNRMADWQRATQRYGNALKHYNRALEVIQQADLDGAADARILNAIALTEHLAKKCCASETLFKALQSQRESAFADEFSKRAAKLNLADFYSLSRNTGANLLYSELQNVSVALLGPGNKKIYALAIERARNLPARAPSSKVYYPSKSQEIKFNGAKHASKTAAASTGKPLRLCATQVPDEGFVDVVIRVSPDGRPHDLKITGVAPIKAKRYLRAVLLDSRYRPEFRDGVAIEQALEFRQYFGKSKPMQMHQVAGWHDILAEHACQLLASR